MVKTRWMTVSTPSRRSGSSEPYGTRYGTPAAVIFFFARVMRAAMVASGTRNARAISGVDRPHTMRSVRATRDSAARLGGSR